jgi:hypothetical protein
MIYFSGASELYITYVGQWYKEAFLSVVYSSDGVQWYTAFVWLSGIRNSWVSKRYSSDVLVENSTDGVSGIQKS